jgi:nitrate/nitrite transport system substrate-binding protein
VCATALRDLIERDRAAGRPPLRFGIVFPYSTHDLELRYWLASAGIDPDRDVSLRVVAPPLDGAAPRAGPSRRLLRRRAVECARDARGCGRTLVTKHEIWNHSPEKVLGVAEAWLERHPGHPPRAACARCSRRREIDEARAPLEVAHVLAGESFVDAPSRCSSARSRGRLAARADLPPQRRHPSRGSRTRSWLLSQMVRWGYIEKPIDLRATRARVYRPDLHREAAADLGLAAPLVDEKVEGSHGSAWMLEEASAPIAMGPDRFFGRPALRSRRDRRVRGALRDLVAAPCASTSSLR